MGNHPRHSVYLSVVGAVLSTPPPKNPLAANTPPYRNARGILILDIHANERRR
jgi:hypothetical protein